MSLPATVFAIRANTPYGVRRKINVTIRITIAYTASSIFLNSSACSGYFRFTPIKAIPIKAANITTEIVDVGRAPVKSRNGFVGNSSNNLSGIVVFSIEVNLSSTNFRRADSASPCCKPVADTSNPALAAIPTAAAIPVVN